MDSGYFALVIPVLLVVLLYVGRKRQRQRAEAERVVAEAVDAASPGRKLEALLLAEHGDGGPTGGESFRGFLRGAPTRRLTAEWFFAIYHGLVGLVLIMFATTLAISGLIHDATARNIVMTIVFVAGCGAWLVHMYAQRRRHALDERLRRVLHAHGLIAVAAVDRTCRVIAAVGDDAALAGSRLPEALLGRHGEAFRMYRAIGAMPLPQVVVLDSEVAIVDRPDRRVAIVAFARASGSAANWDAIAADVSQTISRSFADAGL
jgi:cbb3-type cytochrome oxidase subunit 3